MANRHQPASQKYKDRDVTMVTAPFGKSRKLLPPTIYLGPVSRAAIYSLPFPPFLSSSSSSSLRLTLRYVKTH
jgi:hypothetical protein